jgi:hypothetical protein
MEDFWKKLVNIELLSETFLIVRRIQQEFFLLFLPSALDGTSERQTHETIGLGLNRFMLHFTVMQ